MADSWKIWVDTGGTFTDCFAIDGEGKISTLKVLSNSSLRGKILASDVSNKTIHHLDSDWPVSVDIFQGYLLKTLDGRFTAEIKIYDPVKITSAVQI